jgi:hypothetical protein
MKFWKLLSMFGASLFALLLVLIGILHEPVQSRGDNASDAPRQAPTIPIAR